MKFSLVSRPFDENKSFSNRLAIRTDGSRKTTTGCFPYSRIFVSNLPNELLNCSKGLEGDRGDLYFLLFFTFLCTEVGFTTVRQRGKRFIGNLQRAAKLSNCREDQNGK